MHKIQPLGAGNFVKKPNHAIPGFPNSLYYKELGKSGNVTTFFGIPLKIRLNDIFCIYKLYLQARFKFDWFYAFFLLAMRIISNLSLTPSFEYTVLTMFITV